LTVASTDVFFSAIRCSFRVLTMLLTEKNLIISHPILSHRF
jgi:hypothetical protein